MIDFFTKAAVCAEEVVIQVQNVHLLDPRGKILVLVDGGAQKVTVPGRIVPQGIAFVMPDLSNRQDIRRAFPGSDLTGLALVSVSSGDGSAGLLDVDPNPFVPFDSATPPTSAAPSPATATCWGAEWEPTGV